MRDSREGAKYKATQNVERCPSRFGFQGSFVIASVVVVVEFDTENVMMLKCLQVRIAELEEELEAERASKAKVNMFLHVVTHYLIISYMENLIKKLNDANMLCIKFFF